MDHKVLDHGYLRYVGHYGTESTIVESARMSTGAMSKGLESDHKLLEYLWRHKHLSPFEMADLTIEVQAPIFVAREWMRHRTFSYNEFSGRYSEMPNLFYAPEVFRTQDKKNRQGSGEPLENPHAEDTYREALTQSREAYNRLLNLGVSREMARMVLPLGQYTRFRAKGNLRNWLHFLSLRDHPDAQYEIREYAKALDSIIRDLWPKTWSLHHERSSVG